MVKCNIAISCHKLNHRTYNWEINQVNVSSLNFSLFQHKYVVWTAKFEICGIRLSEIASGRYVAVGAISSRPPMKGLNGSGIITDPSSC